MKEEVIAPATVNIDLDFIIILEDGTPASPAYKLVSATMPKMILNYRVNGQEQMALWTEDALEQLNKNRSLTVFGDQYFFLISYVDSACRLTSYSKAQVMARFIP
jgi:hypothetical protein